MEVLYRKYRPKSFSEIVGQDHVKKVLTNALKMGRVAHAYIFAGPRGTGKTTTARILAKSLNCESRKDAEPCNRCQSCLAIDEGAFMDVVELDAASNRGIDEIRRIREAAGYRPIEGKYKVYIIDEVHMLTKEAFNALLKTLEEPPEHVVFVLATTNLEKVPPTIVSRCQVLEFKNLPENLIFERLKEVSSKERMEIEEDALRFLARRAEGGMRDALTLLEQVWKFSAGGKIALEDVEKALGLIPLDLVRKYVLSIIEGKLEEVLKVVDEVYYSGKDLELLLQEAVKDILDDIERTRRTYDIGHQILIQLARQLMNLMREIRFFEEKRLICRVGSSYIASKFLKEEVVERKEKVVIREKPPEERKKASEEKVTEETKEEKRILEEVLGELKEKGDLSVFVALALADVKISDGKVEVIFDSTKAFHYEILKRKLPELENIFNSKMGRVVDISLKLRTEKETVEEVVNKILRLFPGRVEIEGEE
ncbi:MAG TPA: DNA polymerase III subunit gamma/tau [Thermotoga sp.]|nr:MAG: DNA polymerase III subunit gamma/tau [Thermotogota bacterium]HDG62359.1 DNA polymerase III subunit gamma/tau [Thermotoga sp.]